MITVDVKINDKKNPPLLKFANRCVNCGKAKETSLGISLNMGVEKKGAAVLLKLDAPMCNLCADKERGIAKVTLIPFLIGGLIFGALAFLPAWAIAPEGTMPQTYGFGFVFAGFVSLIVGIIGGSVIEFFVKMLAIPFYGKLVAKRPPTIFSLLTESDQLIGVSAKFLKAKNIVRVTFENEESAREFRQLNSLETK